ncbi:MAG: hypothetical protein ACR2PK_05315 [Acidimicrobiales bacterium]
MIELDAATVLLQWATGGLFFLWVTGRHRLVGIGYGWTIRLSFIVIAGISLVVGLSFNTVWVREICTMGLILAASFAMAASIARRKAGVAGQRELVERRTARVAAMTGINKDEQRFDRSIPEFEPNLDLIAPCIGLIGVIAGGIDAGDPVMLSVSRVVVGAFFLGAVTDAMLLGHWYLVQPGLTRDPIHELVMWTGILWVPELIVMLWPTGMVSVLNGTIDDGYNGILGWFWVACVVTTIGLVFVTRAALREKEYSAVMAATGLLYLAILTGFGMDLVARVLLDT